jgi:hypothetical protein
LGRVGSRPRGEGLYPRYKEGLGEREGSLPSGKDGGGLAAREFARARRGTGGSGEVESAASEGGLLRANSV